MNTPLSYYGGKRQLANIILGLIPPYRLYCKPFLGSAAVFFAVEIINDTNREIINFYEVLRHDFASLEKEITLSPHSRKLHHQTRVIYENPDMFDRVKRAWAVWTLANVSYGGTLDGGFGYDRTTGAYSKKLAHKRDYFFRDYAERLRCVQIECRDAPRIIRSHDTEDAFFYIDSPYVGADQGHYGGYSQTDFDELFEALESLKGKFSLSSYRNKGLAETSKRNGWSRIEFKMVMSMTNRYEIKNKIEVMTANYPIVVDTRATFDETGKA
jgi:DNA adenine methylase